MQYNNRTKGGRKMFGLRLFVANFSQDLSALYTALGTKGVNLKFLALFLLSILSGCSVVVHDKTNDPIALSFIGSYYQTVKDGFLYEARCADINASIQSTEWCTGIQAFDSGSEYSKTPTNYQAYKSAQEEWDTKLFTKLAFEKQRSIISALSKGTVIKITKLVQYPWGTNGYYWAIRADFINTEGNLIEVELPTNSALAFPSWLQGYGVQALPQLKHEYLMQCKNAKCT